MANSSITNYIHNVTERLINYTSTYYAKVRAVIPYNSSEAEIFTAASPGYITPGTGATFAINQGTPGTTNRVDAGSGTTISQTPTITAGAYSAGDAVGGLLTFANAARSSGGGGVINLVQIIDDAGQDVELELWLFNATFTATSDNAAWAPSEADLRKKVAVISTRESAGGWCAAGTPSSIDIEISRRYDLVGTSMFGQLVSPTGTPTFANIDDVTVILGLLQD